jgi:lipoate-protein ligase B
MTTAQIQFFPSWSYDEAIQWMSDANALVSRSGTNVIIGCGSHREQVITIGKQKKNGKSPPQALGPMIRHIDRGGGMTAHEPGQIVLYPVFNIKERGLSVVQLIGLVEQTIVDFIAAFGLVAHRSSQGPGVYLLGKKMGFVGFRIKDFITSHGLAVNVKNDALIFKTIEPCGIQGLAVTSLKDHVMLNEPLEVYMRLLTDCFQQNFALL